MFIAQRALRCQVAILHQAPLQRVGNIYTSAGTFITSHAFCSPKLAPYVSLYLFFMLFILI